MTLLPAAARVLVPVREEASDKEKVGLTATSLVLNPADEEPGGVAKGIFTTSEVTQRTEEVASEPISSWF